MKRVRMTAWILALVLLLGCMTFTAAAEGELNLYSIVAIEEDTIWIHTSAGLVPFDKEGWQIGKALYPDANCYAIGPDGHIYYSMDGDVFAMDSEGNEVDKWETPIERFTKMLVNEKYIILMNGAEYAVIDAAAHTMLGGAADGVLDISLYDGESFVIVQNRGSSPYARLNCKTLEVMEEINLHTGYSGIVSAGADEGIYLYDNSRIDHMASFEADKKVYKNIPDAQFVRDILMDAENIYAIADNDLKVYPRQEEVAPTKFLSIRGIDIHYDNKLKKAIEIFTQRHPEYRVDVSTDGVIRSTRLELMANAPGYDLIVLHPVHTDFKLSDVVMDLSGSETLMENLGNYIDMPFLWESDGSLYGIPLDVSPYGFRVLSSLWEEIGASFPERWTWEDLYAYADIARDLDTKLVSTDYRWTSLRQEYETAYCDLMNGIADYENDTFRFLVSLWKRMDTEQLVDYNGIYQGNALFSHGSMQISYGMGQKHYINVGMPTLNGEEITPIEMTALYVNRYSENADAAVEFLEIYTSHEVQMLAEWSTAMYLKDVEIEEYAYVEEVRAMAELSGWSYLLDAIPTEEEWEQWQHYLSTGRLVERVPEYEEAVKELVIELLTDKMTEDEFVAEVQERADLMIGE